MVPPIKKISIKSMKLIYNTLRVGIEKEIGGRFDICESTADI